MNITAIQERHCPKEISGARPPTTPMQQKPQQQNQQNQQTPKPSTIPPVRNNPNQFTTPRQRQRLYKYSQYKIGI